MNLTPGLVALTSVGLATLAACKDPASPPFTFDKCDGSVGFPEIGYPTTCATTASKSVNTVVGVAIKGTNIAAAMTNYEVGSKLSAKGGTPNKDGNVLTIPIADKIKALTLPQLLGTDPIAVDTSITLSSPRYADAVLELPPLSAGRAFFNSETAEQVLVTDKVGLGASPPATHSIFVASWTFPDSVMGDAKSLADIDWVALPTFKGTKEASICQYETEKGGGVDYKTKVEVYTVKLVDRRSGNVIDSKEFDAPGECPSSISSSTQVWFEFDTAESWGEVKQWLASKLAG